MARARGGTHAGLGKLRRLAAKLPETAEQLTWGHPTFRVRGKIFASFGEHEDEPVVTVKCTKAHQALLVDGPGFFVAPYVGQHGWVGIRLGQVDWPVVAELVEESYRLVAPKKLVALLDPV